MRRLAVALAVAVSLPIVGAGVARADKLAGIAADGSRYLEGKRRVCAAAAVDASGQVVALPACEEVEDKQALAAYEFVPRKKLKVAKTDATGRVRFLLVTDGAKLTVRGESPAGERDLAEIVFPGDVVKARGPYLAADGAMLVIEVDRKEGKKKLTETVGFDVRAGLAALAPPKGGVVDRVLGKARVWVQQLIPCEQAGVTLELGPADAFVITTDVKCQGMRDKLKVKGEFVGQEPDVLLFTFHNQGADDEQLSCRLEACPGGSGEECISCASEDVTFTLAPKP